GHDRDPLHRPLRLANRRGDGGLDGLCRSGAHHLRHVQERGERHRHRNVATDAQVGRKIGLVGTIGRLSFAIALAAASAVAQVRETTTVEVVEVPVYVTAKGAPIIGLTQDNFELYINGKRQTIDYFDTTDYANLSSEQSHDVRQRRLYMLVFDMLSPSNALQHAQKAALQFVENSAANDTIGVA